MSGVYLVVLVMAGMCLMATAYDVKFYKKKLRSYFIGTDRNSNGIAEEANYQLIAAIYADILKYDDKQIDKLHKNLIPKAWRTFEYDALQEGKPTRFEEFFETVTRLRESETFRNSAVGVSRQLFQMLDADKNNRLNVTEFGAVIIGRRAPASDVHVAFDATDRNEDGQIQPKEYTDGFVYSIVGVDPNDPSTLFWGPLIDKYPS